MTDKRLQEIADILEFDLYAAKSVPNSRSNNAIILSALQRVREEEEREKQKPLGLPEADGNAGDTTRQN